MGQMAQSLMFMMIIMMMMMKRAKSLKTSVCKIMDLLACIIILYIPCIYIAMLSLIQKQNLHIQ
jgi:hypothetical protein